MMELRSLVNNKTNAVYDFEFIKALREVPFREWFLVEGRALDCQKEYIDYFHEWIKSSQLNSFTGLEQFSVRSLINGTTQCFDEAYFKFHDRRLRFFRGEYAYHRRVFKNNLFLEDAPLEKNDWVIISLPFCSSGDVHEKMAATLDQALALSVPVIVDCAYFGTCHGVKFDLSHPAITEVCFSLSKGIGLGDIRSGIRYSKVLDQMPINQHNQYNHNVLLAAKVGLYMMGKFSPDFIANKYLAHQISVCSDLNLTPTKCMHIGLGKREEWGGEFFIDDTFCRIGLRQAVKERMKKLV